MTTAVSDPQIVPRPLALPELRAADQGVADALESVLSDNTRRVYGAQWRFFTGWCGEVGLASLPAEPLTVAHYLAARADARASVGTLRLATSAITKAHEWAKPESPCRDPGVRASLKGWGRRLSRSPSGRPAPLPNGERPSASRQRHPMLPCSIAAYPPNCIGGYVIWWLMKIPA